MKKKEKKTNQRKEELIKLSNVAKKYLNSGHNLKDTIGFDGIPTINNLVVFLNYPKGTFNTFKGWRELGYSVTKGQKGYPIWGRKLKVKKQEENKKQEKEAKNGYRFFPLAYIFHESQVEKLEEK